MKKYVVVETSFDYNDEYYTQSEHGAGTPILITDSLEAAEHKATELEISAYKNVELREYSYDIDELVSSEFVEALKIIDPSIEDVRDDIENEEFDFSKYTDEQIVELMQHVSIQFYKVEECEYLDA